MSNSKTSAELVLGTARLGEPDNNNAEMATLVLQSAIRAGLRWIETSASYTASEERIGRAFRSTSQARIVTKLLPLEEVANARSVRDWAITQVNRSSMRLNTSRLDVVALNSVREMHSHGGTLWRTLKEMRDEGTIFDLGVSVTSPEEALQAIDDPNVHYLQLQFNALDWRWREAGVVDALADRPEVTVHAHSALLYGMLAGAPGSRWPAADEVDPDALRTTLWQLARDLGRDCPADLCIAYVRAQPWIHGVIAGAQNVGQLALNLARFNRRALSSSEIAHVNAALPRMPSAMLGAPAVSRAA